MSEITDTHYLAAAKALLCIKPEHTHISDTFVLSMVGEVCDPEFFRAALNIAYDAGQRDMRQRARRYIGTAAQNMARPGGGLSDPITALAWRQASEWFGNDSIWEPEADDE